MEIDCKFLLTVAFAYSVPEVDRHGIGLAVADQSQMQDLAPTENVDDFVKFLDFAVFASHVFATSFSFLQG